MRRAALGGLALALVQLPPDDVVPLTLEERAWVAAHPVVVVAPTGDYHPTEFFDGAGAWSGMTADVFAWLEARLPLRFEVRHLSRAETANASPREMGVDVVPLSAPTPSRMREWLFSEPYLEYPVHVLVRDDRARSTLRELGRARVGVVRGWAAEEYLRGTYPELEVARSEDTRSGLRELSFGQLDAFVSDLPSATWALREEGLSNLRVGTESGLVYRMGIATRADWPVLHGLLCRALERMPKSEIDAIYERWVHPGAPPIGHSRRTVWILLGLAGSAALLAIAVLAWNRGLAREVGRRTAEVQHELAARQKAEERQHFMVRELDHRVKNTLATVLAVSDQTRRRSGSLDEFAVVFRGRISALSRVHEALSTNSWQGAGLRDVAERTLAPHTPGRVRLVGPDVVLPPASVQPLSMALHELTTNAVKYGALSNEVGVIELAWEELPDGRLRLTWTESGGPSVAHPENPGFGTKLVSAGITYELNGQVELSFAPEGVRCVITLP